MRPLEAHMPPSLIFQGIAVSELLAAGMFILTSKPETHRTTIFRMSCIAWVLVVVVTAIDIAILDFFVSPYPLADKFWHPKMVMSSFAVGLINDFVMLALFIIRLRIFYRDNSLVFWGLVFLGCMSMIIVLPGDYISIAANIDVLNGKYAFFTDSPNMAFANVLFAVSNTAKGLFSALSSMAFLWAIGKGLGFSKKGFLYEIMLNHDGLRFLVIIGLNFTVVLFTLLAYLNGYNYITYCAWYLPSLISSVEVRTFLIASYVAPRDIIERNRLGLTATSPISGSQIRSYNNGNSFHNKQSHSKEEAKRSRYDIELEEQRKDTVRYF
ncbi:hypothetical protein HK105_204354 [Polyrhizophydium stewartii]|uniref:Uncharacterized protein n=1 Tax=Polyrhizophydium stewartii TaxID=2732419 RepID=A0ABR4N9S9_9FUNG|nr:hypothetical protein HK105_001675 [Polyrhizophydium stewartii]